MNKRSSDSSSSFYALSRLMKYALSLSNIDLIMGFQNLSLTNRLRSMTLRPLIHQVNRSLSSNFDRMNPIGNQTIRSRKNLPVKYLWATVESSSFKGVFESSFAWRKKLIMRLIKNIVSHTARTI